MRADKRTKRKQGQVSAVGTTGAFEAWIKCSGLHFTDFLYGEPDFTEAEERIQLDKFGGSCGSLGKRKWWFGFGSDSGQRGKEKDSGYIWDTDMTELW